MNILNILFWTSRETMCVVHFVTCSFLLLIWILWFIFFLKFSKEKDISFSISFETTHCIWFNGIKLAIFPPFFHFLCKTQRIIFEAIYYLFWKKKKKGLAPVSLNLQFMVEPQWNNLPLLIKHYSLPLLFFINCH